MDFFFFLILGQVQAGFFKKNPNEKSAAFCLTEQNEMNCSVYYVITAIQYENNIKCGMQLQNN